MKCKNCGGTGKIYTARSAFRADGYARQTCAICGGSGESHYRPDAAYAKWQKALRDEHHPHSNT